MSRRRHTQSPAFGHHDVGPSLHTGSYACSGGRRCATRGATGHPRRHNTVTTQFQRRAVRVRAATAARLNGLTLAEALVAIAVATIAGTALLTALANSVQSSSVLLRRTIGLGLAQQMLDEIAASTFPVYPDGFQPQPDEHAGSRLSFDDIDDYDGWSSRPPVDRNGRPLGTTGTEKKNRYVPRPTSMQANPLLIERFSRSVTVEFVEPGPDGEWFVRTKPTDWRRVTVTIRHTDLAGRTQTVATLTEVFARVPQ